MASNFIAEPKAKVVFKPNAEDMYAAGRLPTSARKAVEVLGKICDDLETWVPDLADTAETFVFVYTVQQARIALSNKPGAYGGTGRKAYLPKIMRHLIVQVVKNFKDPIPVVQEFTNNKRFMKMLDASWMTAEVEGAKKKKPAKAAPQIDHRADLRKELAEMKKVGIKVSKKALAFAEVIDEEMISGKTGMSISQCADVCLMMG